MKNNPSGAQPHRLDSESSSLEGEPKNRFPQAGVLRAILGEDSLWSPILRKCAVGLVAMAGVALLGMQAPLPPRTPAPSPSTDDAAELASLDAPGTSRASEGTSGASPVSGASSPSAPPSGRPEAPVDPCNRGGVKATPPNAPLGLNSATAEDFERLPGVGPKKAQEIVKLRARLGKFKRVSDLLRVRGVGFKTLQKWKPLVVVDEPAPVGSPQPSSEARSTGDASPAGGSSPSQAESGSAQAP